MCQFICVGFRFNNSQPKILFNSTNVKLEADPNNKYDSNAIKVLVNNKLVAHVAREYCDDVHEFLKQNKSKYNVVIDEIYPASVSCQLKQKL